MTLIWQSERRLSEFSTFGIGGPIRHFTEIRSSSDVEEAFQFIRQIKLPFFILGKGSNCLFDDLGFNGVVLLNRIDGSEWNEQSVRVGSGFSFPLLGIQAAKKNLKGLEFAAGIPATVGGAIFMNAGANQQTASDRLTSVKYFDFHAGWKILTKEELSFQYRHSSFQKMEGMIVEATFTLEPDATARQRQLAIIEKRMQTQPLKEKSAGCVFMNPSPHESAGKLIEQCGLKGLSVGSAKVSDIHANFIVNNDSSKAKDVLALIEQVQKVVLEKTQIRLEVEIKVVPPDGISR
jgi:UDP-N-acetylmuramate dehydrogenase